MKQRKNLLTALQAISAAALLVLGLAACQMNPIYKVIESIPETSSDGAVTVEPSPLGIKVTLRKPTGIKAKNSELRWDQAYVTEKTTGLVLDFGRQHIFPTDENPEVSLIYPFTDAGKKYSFGVTYQIFNKDWTEEFSTWNSQTVSVKADVTNLKFEDYFNSDNNPNKALLKANDDGTISLSEDVRNFFKTPLEESYIITRFVAGRRNGVNIAWNFTGSYLKTYINGDATGDFSYEELLNNYDVRPLFNENGWDNTVINKGDWAAFDNFLFFTVKDEKAASKSYTLAIKMGQVSVGEEASADAFRSTPKINFVTGHENDSTPVRIDSIKYDDNSGFFFYWYSTGCQYAKTEDGQEGGVFEWPEIPGLVPQGLYYDSNFQRPFNSSGRVIPIDSEITLYLKYGSTENTYLTFTISGDDAELFKCYYNGEVQEFPVTFTPTQNSISVYAFIDSNENGFYDEGEIRVFGWYEAGWGEPRTYEFQIVKTTANFTIPEDFADYESDKLYVINNIRQSGSSSRVIVPVDESRTGSITFYGNKLWQYGYSTEIALFYDGTDYGNQISEGYYINASECDSGSVDITFTPGSFEW